MKMACGTIARSRGARASAPRPSSSRSFSRRSSPRPKPGETATRPSDTAYSARARSPRESALGRSNRRSRSVRMVRRSSKDLHLVALLADRDERRSARAALPLGREPKTPSRSPRMRRMRPMHRRRPLSIPAARVPFPDGREREPPAATGRRRRRTRPNEDRCRSRGAPTARVHRRDATECREEAPAASLARPETTGPGSTSTHRRTHRSHRRTHRSHRRTHRSHRCSTREPTPRSDTTNEGRRPPPTRAAARIRSVRRRSRSRGSPGGSSPIARRRATISARSTIDGTRGRGRSGSRNATRNQRFAGWSGSTS